MHITNRTLAITAGVSYLMIFFLAIYANFFVLESLKQEPLETISAHGLSLRLGIVAFLITAVCDVVVAWALKLMFKDHPLTALSTYFRIIHAVIMGLGVFALVPVLNAVTREEVITQVNTFNTIWLIGLLFFGVHLVLLARILRRPVLIAFFLMLAGVVYMVDTAAHFTLSNYEHYADIFLMVVAVPSVLGEMSFTLWLLLRGGK